MHALFGNFSLIMVIFYFVIISAPTILFNIIRLNYKRAFNWEYLTVFVRKAFIKFGLYRALFLNWLLFLLFKDWILLLKRLTSKVGSQLLTWNQFWIVRGWISCWNFVCLQLAHRKTIEILFWSKTGRNTFTLNILGCPGNTHAKLRHAVTFFLNDSVLFFQMFKQIFKQVQVSSKP